MSTSVGTAARARNAMAHTDFRRLFAVRISSQFADGLLLAVLTASTVFNTENRQTTHGLFINTLVISLPFCVIGPFVGVFIDRWSRRRILWIAPILKAALIWLVLFDPDRAAVPFFAGALLVLSVNRFFLATAGAVMPRVVPTEDLLVANSLATVGGTVALLAGAFTGGQISDAFGNAPAVIACAALWAATTFIARRIRTDLGPHLLQRPAPIAGELGRVARETGDGLRHLLATPRAVGPVTAITVDQFGQGLLTVLSLVVFKVRFKEGVGSFSWLVAAGGVGVMLGIVSVGAIEQRFGKLRTISGAFVAGGLVVTAVATHISPVTVLIASFSVGLTFAWKKIPIDTMVQESLPDAYRGRVFSIYDVVYNLARVLSAAIAIPLLPRVGVGWSVAIVGVAFILWSPALPLWLRRAPEITLRFYAGATGEEWPRSILWGGVEETVEVERSWREERRGERLTCFRLVLEDGTVLDVSRREPDGEWRVDGEGTRTSMDVRAAE